MQAIVVIIALVFIFWGVGTQLMNRNRSAITVNDEEISFQQFQKSYEQALTRLRDQFNGAIPQGFAEKIGLKKQVINRFVQESLFRQGGQKMGLIVSPAEIQDEIVKMPQFEDNGTFSTAKYQFLLSRNGYTPHGFEDSLRHDMLAQKTISNIEGFASIVTDEEIKDLFDLEKESVAVSFAKISPETFNDKVNVTDKDLASWFETVKDNYKTDPQLQLKYLSFDFGDIAKKITPDENAIKEYYNKNIEKFSTPEQRQARHILFKLEPNSSEKDAEAQRKKAEKVLQLARSGQDFAKLAEQYSEGPTAKQGGDLGFFQEGQMVKAFNDAVFSMKPGDISDLVRSPFGYHIIKLEAIKPAVAKPLSEVRDEVVRDLQTSKAKAEAFQMANDCYEGIIGAGSLQAYIKKHPEAAIIETRFFARQSPPETIKDDKKFLDAAFALKQGELSSLIETKKGYAILYAEHIKEPAVPNLADIKDRVTKDFIAARAAEMAKKSAEDILARAKAGGNFAQIVQGAGLTVRSSGLLSKSQGNPDSSFPSSLINKIFQLSNKSPYPAEVSQAGKDYYVYKFAERMTPKMDLNDNERAQYKAALLRLKQQEILNAWLYHARKHAVVTTYKGL
jgi:peptidyl-prolyl cis-trans isomerase D